MGAKDKRKKDPIVKDAEITADGLLIVTMNVKFKMGNTDKIILPPETIYALGEEYGSMPPASETDYPGTPVVEVESVFADEGEEPDEGDEEAPAEEE